MMTMNTDTLIDYLQQFAAVLHEEQAVFVGHGSIDLKVDPSRLVRAAEITAALLGEIAKHGDVYSVRVHRVPGNGPFWALTIWMAHDTEGNPWVDSIAAGGDYEDGAFYLWVDPSDPVVKTPAADEVPF
jgi:hypothetical protein